MGFEMEVRAGSLGRARTSAFESLHKQVSTTRMEPAQPVQPTVLFPLRHACCVANCFVSVLEHLSNITS